MVSFRLIPALTLILAIGAGVRDATAGNDSCQGNGRRASGCSTLSANSAPTISGTPSPDVMVGSTYVFTPTASDPDSRSLSFRIVNKPTWATFNSNNGRLSGTPGASAEGEYIGIVISVSDNRSTTSLPAFSIVVTAGNHAPSISGAPATSAREGQVYDFVPSASDPDGNTLSFTIANRPAWATFDPQTGRLTGNPGPGTVGVYSNITIRVSDGTTVTSLPAFAINVEQASLGSVTLTWTPPTSREDGTPLTDLAGYRVRYGTAPGNYPNQLQIANPGITTCVIENLPGGTYYFVATAYDATGHESQFSTVVSKTIG